MTQLFKYVSNEKYILEDGYIRATQLEALNDPFEATYCKKSLKKLSKHFEGCEKGKELIKSIEDEKHNIGIISFSESKDNLLMWAHYGNEYSGYLIGASTIGVITGNIFHKLFPFWEDSGIKKIYDGTFSSIHYRKQFSYKIDMFDRDYSNISRECKNRILYDIFRHKSEEWIYEKEHRIILRLEQADKIIILDLDSNRLRELNNFFDLTNIIVEKENKTIFFMERIKKEEDRSELSSILAKYARDNPNNLYLFKLDGHSICSLSIGPKLKNYNNKNAEKYDSYIKSKGSFDIYKVKENKSNYTLDFKKLYDKYDLN